MKTKFSIKNNYGQLFQSIEMELTPEEMLDLFWILQVTIHELDIQRVRNELEIMRHERNYIPTTSEELTNV